MRGRQVVTSVVAVLALAACATWPQVGGGPAHTGAAVASIRRTDVPQLTRVWSKPIPSQFGGHVEAVSDGVTIYLVIPSDRCSGCLSNLGHVAAYDLATGHRRWTSAHVEAVRSESLAVGDGIVVASGEACTYGYDAATGVRRWAHCLLNPIGPPTLANGFVYEVTPTYTFELRASDGTWTGRDFGNEYSAPLAEVGDGKIVSGARTYDAASGALVWQDPMYADRTIVDGVVYALSDDGDLYATDLDAHPITEVWRVTLGCLAPASPPAVDATTVYVQDCGTLRALDRATGRERWHSDDGEFGLGDDRVTVVGDLLYLTNESTTLSIVDKDDGSLVRAITLGDPAGSNQSVGPPVVANGHVIIAGQAALEVYAAT